MAPKKRAGSKKKKSKKVKYIPDPDEQYRKTLEEQLYIPKATRDAICARHRQELKDAVAVSAATGKDQTVDLNAIPLTHLPNIIRCVGLNPTKDQVSMMEAMVCDSNNGDEGTQSGGARLINYEKLEKTVLDVLTTRVLAYDPQVLTTPHPCFPSRVSSVVLAQDEERLRALFEVLWKGCGSQFSGTNAEIPVRCINVSDLKNVLMAPDIKRTEIDFTPDEIEDFLFTFRESGTDVVREDAFLLALLDV